MSPDLSEQCAFEALERHVNRLKAVVQAALNKVQLLFDSLMQKYFG